MAKRQGERPSLVTFGKKLKEARERHHLSQGAVSARCRVSNRTISMLENGSAEGVNDQILLRLAVGVLEDDSQAVTQLLSTAGIASDPDAMQKVKAELYARDVGFRSAVENMLAIATQFKTPDEIIAAVEQILDERYERPEKIQQDVMGLIESRLKLLEASVHDHMRRLDRIEDALHRVAAKSN